VKGDAGLDERFVTGTPDDLKALGWVYVPCVDAPAELNACISLTDTKVSPYRGLPTVLLFGGLNDALQFKGTGLTPLGKEAEARVVQMLAGGASEADIEAALLCAAEKMEDGEWKIACAVAERPNYFPKRLKYPQVRFFFVLQIPH
jgi:hypothetical protein